MYITVNAWISNLISPQYLQWDMPSAYQQTYAQRAAIHANPAAKALLETIERKRSNLCVSVDVTKRADFLRIIDIVGPYICLVKVSGASTIRC